MTSHTLDDGQRAWRYVELLFRYRLRTRHEVRERLLQRGFTPSVVEHVLQRLQQGGWLDDARFAYRWARERAQRYGYGPRRLRQELRHRGVEGHTVDEVIAEIFELEGELEQARALAQRWLQRWQHLDPLTRRRRLSGRLQRRGHRGEVIQRVLRSLDL